MSLPSKTYRDEFILPDNKSVGAINAEKQGGRHVVTRMTQLTQYEPTPDSACVYLCGNSLGACPKRSLVLVQEELNAWGKLYALFDNSERNFSGLKM